MKKKSIWLVLSYLMMTALVMMSCCQARTEEEEPTAVIFYPGDSFQKDSIIAEFPMDNCVNPAKVKKEITESISIGESIKLSEELTVEAGGSVQIPGIGSINLGTEIAKQVGVDYSKEESSTRSITPEAEPKTNGIYTVYRHDEIQRGRLVIQSGTTEYQTEYELITEFWLSYQYTPLDCPKPTIISPGSSSPLPVIILDNLTPTFKWNALSGAEYYNLTISKYPYGSENVVHSPQQLAGTSYDLPSGVLEGGEKYCWNIQACGPGGWDFVSSFLYFETPVIVTFNAHLEAAIRSKIGKPIGNIFPADLEGMTSLRVDGKGITDLTGLEYCTGLTTLTLRENQISNISPLANLTNLTELWFHENDIIDISPLASLINLNRLYLSENQISDISPLASLTSLTNLTLHKNQISDISPLANLTKLTYLSLHENQISDIGPLASLTNLILLQLAENQISDISPLASLTSLTNLTLLNNPISDIWPLVQNSGLDAGDTVYLYGLPLSQRSVNNHIPQLEARGVDVRW